MESSQTEREQHRARLVATIRQASDAFTALVKRADVPRIGGIHALRPHMGKLALQAGVHPKVGRRSPARCVTPPSARP